MSTFHLLVIDCDNITEIKRQTDISIGERIPSHISIPDTRTFNDGSRDVTLYQIFIKSASGGQIIIERRFSEFFALSDAIKAQKDDRNLQGVLPSLPGKTVMPWVDQTSATFIEDRREALQQYMQDLLSNARVGLAVFCVAYFDCDSSTQTVVSYHHLH